MRIAFDLDNTLIRCGFEFELENPQRIFLAQVFTHEKLRKGTREIFQFCQQQGWETWIYTSSYRSLFYIRSMFWLYGISLQGIVNQTIHEKNVKLRISKYPPAFRIDVLIEDNLGVKMEGEKMNFAVILIAPEEENWVETIKKELTNLSHFPKTV